MNPFSYTRAGAVEDAVALADTEGSKYLGGGTNLVDLMRETLERPSSLVDVTGISTTIEETANGGLRIGAGVRNSVVAGHFAVRTRYPMLARALLAGASSQIRNMATVGGNILQRTRCTYFYDDDGSHCNKRIPGQGCDAIDGFNRSHAILGSSPACVATHPSDMCVALSALDAVVHLRNAKVERSVHFTDFHQLPGDTPQIETVLEPGELITAVELPAQSFLAHSTYRKVRDRASYAFALVSVAAALDIKNGSIRDVRIALGGVAHKPWRAFKAETALRGQAATPENFRTASEAELAEARPLRGNAFKVELAKRTITAVLQELAEGTSMSIKSAATKLMQKAIETAPDKWMPGGTPDPLIQHKHGHVGAPVTRIDGPLKVSGKAPFAAEFPIESMLFAAVAYSTIAKGRMTSLDTSAAENAPGVLLVMSFKNGPKLKPTPIFNSSPKAAGPSDLPIMQDDCIHWNGEAIAVVLAETQEQADYAKSLIRATYQEEPASIVFDDAKRHAREPETILGEVPTIEEGDAETALAAASHRVDAMYRTPRHNHNPIELHAVTLFWKKDELHLHDASQAVSQTAWTLEQVFGLKEGQVHVSSPYVGGGFGSKTLWHHHVLAAAASRLAGRPVRLVLSREGVYRTVGGRTTTEQRVAIGADRDGHFAALIHTGVAAMTAHNDCPEQFTFPARHLYSVPTFKIGQQVADMDMLANTFMRAPGESIGTFALESAVDELAAQMGIDPVELRLRNEPEKDPTSGKPFSSRNLAKAYRDGAKRFGWNERHTTPGTRREGEWLVGMGCATATYPYYRMPGGRARLTLSSDGYVTAEFAAHEMGMGTATAQSQVVAERFGVNRNCVRVNHGHSHFAGSFLAGGSSQTASIGASVIAAHKEMVEELLKLAGRNSPLHGLSWDKIHAHDGGLYNIADPSQGETYAAILHRSGKNEVSVEADAPAPIEAQHWSMHSFGAMFAEVRVNAITGETRVSRFLGSFDCGRILNPKTAASQFRGGIIMGVGLALMEETQWDERKGRIMNPSLAEYHVPVHMDVPKIEVIWTDIPDPHTPMGARGIGEIGITGTGAAIANAVYNACGKRVRELPITLDKLI